jgi:bifunctional non-homologous end joining protein LigD
VKALSATTARLPDFVEPMKAKLVGSIPSGNWIYEIKFDGYRALAFRGGSETRILSRNQKDLGGKFTEVKDSIAALDIQDAIIDGEIVALDQKRPFVFSAIARTRHGPRETANRLLRF